MTKKVFDTSKLVAYWRKRYAEESRPLTVEIVVAWADSIISMYDTDCIVTPVEIEFICGAATSSELNLYNSFLSRFRMIDEGSILPLDWSRALELARRIPQDGRRRQMGDCLIRAIADRLKHDVLTSDTGFPTRGRG